VADPADGDRRAFDLFGWTGRRGDAAVPLAGAADALASLHDEGGHFAPEAMVVDPTGTRMLLLSDDGDRRMQGGAKCKDVPDVGARRFRSVTLGLD
jgi:hypothetical protein